MAKHRQTKATDISPKVKAAVWERDGHACVVCGSYRAFPESHYYPRSAGGLGVEQNIVTLCRQCHDAWHSGDVGTRCTILDYLREHYEGWDDLDLHYHKYD